MSAETLDVDYLRSILDYDPETGVFRWAKPRPKIQVGAIAGCVNHWGYIQLMIDGKNYRAHRLVWLYVHGIFPSNDLDHIDGDRTNNRISNLREGTRGENMQNQRRARGVGTSKFLGVSWHKGAGKWTARIRVDSKEHYLGLFDTEEKAATAYLKAKKELHPFSMLGTAK